MAFRRNDTGHSITQMQNGLLGWDSTVLPTFGADGDYGAETEAAVHSYQLAAQLDQVADTELGVCDGNTHNQLLEYVSDKLVGNHDHDAKEHTHPPTLVPHAHDELYAAAVHPHIVTEQTTVE